MGIGCGCGRHGCRAAVRVRNPHGFDADCAEASFCVRLGAGAIALPGRTAARRGVRACPLRSIAGPADKEKPLRTAYRSGSKGLRKNPDESVVLRRRV